MLRAITARSICAAGLHPALGVHHHNRYDPFCLASDLMEPYRPLVDGCVVALEHIHGGKARLDKEVKRDLLSALAGEFSVGNEAGPLFAMVSRTAQSLAESYGARGGKLRLPKWS